MIVGKEGVNKVALLIKCLPLCDNVTNRFERFGLFSKLCSAAAGEMVKLEESTELPSLVRRVTNNLVNITCPTFADGKDVTHLVTTEKGVDMVVELGTKTV